MAQSTFVGQEQLGVKNPNLESKAPPSRRGEQAEPSSRRAGQAKRKKGLALERRYTTPETDALANVVWERRQSIITNPDGSVVFKMEGAEIPATWSQLATDIVVSKYFRKAGLHGDKTQGETQRAAGRPPHRAHHPRRGRDSSAATSPRRRTPTPSRPSSPTC